LIKVQAKAKAKEEKKLDPSIFSCFALSFASALFVETVEEKNKD